jgi:hypothetical protein
VEVRDQRSEHPTAVKGRFAVSGMSVRTIAARGAGAARELGNADAGPAWCGSLLGPISESEAIAARLVNWLPERSTAAIPSVGGGRAAGAGPAASEMIQSQRVSTGPLVGNGNATNSENVGSGFPILQQCGQRNWRGPSRYSAGRPAAARPAARCLRSSGRVNRTWSR